MNTLTFADGSKKTIAILIKDVALNEAQIYAHYVRPLEELGIDPNRVIAFGLLYEGKKVRAKIAKAHLNNLQEYLNFYPIEQLIVADSTYFKIISGISKVSKAFGENVRGTYADYVKYDLVYVPNYLSLIYDPNNQGTITAGLKAVAEPKKKEIITYARYAANAQQAEKLLDGLMSCHALTCDIETTGLALGSELVSISFAWNEHQGIAIYCHNKPSILLGLKRFFDQFSGKLIFHRALFDVKHLIWILYMSNPQDLPGLILGLRVFRHVEDSQLLTYLALNSTTEVSLGLKENSYEFTGNYAVDVTNCLNVPPDELLVYNLKDALATWYVWNKYWPVCEKDDQLRVYAEIFQPSIKPLLKMMLTGIPIDLDRVAEIEDYLRKKQRVHEYKLECDPRIIAFNKRLQKEELRTNNASLKRKFKAFSDFRHVKFNPDSPQQVAQLLYENLEYKVTRKTDTGQPSTGTKVLQSLLGKGRHDDLIDHLIERKKTNKILTSFIPAFYEYTIDGFLHGELNLGGTQSGRLSSSNPNLQNQPSGSTYGKLIKSCFRALPGWLFWGIDFNALEERIGSILSGDPNRIKVYTDGFDGHCLRAFRYFGKYMHGIDPSDPASINSIEQLFPKFRNKSKAPTFALQYGGTAYTLTKNCNLPTHEAEAIENAYHDLYKVSDAFMNDNLKFAHKHGYVECAFGLRLRTPLLQKSVIQSSNMPYQAKAEGRSANNAITQSWGLLINRALIEADQIWNASEYRESILLCNTIHDSTYGLVRNDPETVKFLNDTIVSAMEWNDHIKIKSAEVPMVAKLELGHSWDRMLSIENRISADKIAKIIKKL